MKPQQLTFASLVAQGDSQVDAYLAAFPKAKRDSARSAAARLMKNPDVAGEVTRLRAKAETAAVLSLQEKRERLATISRKPAADAPKVSDQISAMVLDSKLAGDFFADRDTPARISSLSFNSSTTAFPRIVQNVPQSCENRL